MADFFDQAKAIWKTLDEMSAKDPEEYKRFISEQLQDGKNSMFQGSGQQPGQPPTGKKTSSGQKQDLEQPLMEALGKLSLNRTPNATVLPNAAKKSESDKKKAGNGSNSKAEKSGKSNPNAKKGEKGKDVNLLDDEILDKSMISNIVNKANQGHSNPEGKDPGDKDPEVTIIGELRIPSAESFPIPRTRNKNAPLIEEL